MMRGDERLGEGGGGEERRTLMLGFEVRSGLKLEDGTLKSVFRIPSSNFEVRTVNPASKFDVSPTLSFHHHHHHQQVQTGCVAFCVARLFVLAVDTKNVERDGLPVLAGASGEEVDASALSCLTVRALHSRGGPRTRRGGCGCRGARRSRNRGWPSWRRRGLRGWRRGRGRGKRGGSVDLLEPPLGLRGSSGGDSRLCVRVCRLLERLLLGCHEFGAVWIFWCQSSYPLCVAWSWW